MTKEVGKLNMVNLGRPGLNILWIIKKEGENRPGGGVRAGQEEHRQVGLRQATRQVEQVAGHQESFLPGVKFTTNRSLSGRAYC